MKKQKTFKLNNEVYLLGRRKSDNKLVYMEIPSWDCGWYWGFGYIQTYTTTDLLSHEHFDSLFLEHDIYDSFKDYFIETPLDNEEIWQLLGYMKEFYVAREYAELLHHGNYITHKAKNIEEIQGSQEEEKRINEIILPKLFEKIDKLLTKGMED